MRMAFQEVRTAVKKRQVLLRELGLPERLTAKALVPVLNSLVNYEEVSESG